MDRKDIILNLKTMFLADKFIVTGSYTLAMYGLVPKDSVRDLDIILVNPTPGTIELLNQYMTDHPAPTTAKLKQLQEKVKLVPKKPPRDDDEDEKPYKAVAAKTVTVKISLKAIFMFDNVKIDVYIEDYFSEPVLSIDGILYTTIPHIISAKKSYGRMKDWLHCRDMARMIYDPDQFQKMLNGDWKTSLNDSALS